MRQTTLLTELRAKGIHAVEAIFIPQLSHLKQLLLSKNPAEVRLGWEALYSAWGFGYLPVEEPAFDAKRINKESKCGRRALYIPHQLAKPSNLLAWNQVPQFSRCYLGFGSEIENRPFEGWQFVECSLEPPHPYGFDPIDEQQKLKSADGMTINAYLAFIGWCLAVYSRKTPDPYHYSCGKGGPAVLLAGSTKSSKPCYVKWETICVGSDGKPTSTPPYFLFSKNPDPYCDTMHFGFRSGISAKSVCRDTKDT